MLSNQYVLRSIVAYRLKLNALLERFERGGRATVATEAQRCGDELVCLMEEASLEHRERIDYLIDRYETLRVSSAN